jgi:NAD(P)H-dependent flavin oxidoreductase YrpB (nitropropane dioxygenase family)
MKNTARTPLCDLLGIEHPIVGFTPSEHVAAAVSRAGGLGVLGCVRFNDPAELDAVLTWMDENTGGRPYGIDVVMPATVPTEGAATDLGQLIPDAHKAFVAQTLLDLGVPPLPDDTQAGDGVLGWLHSVARKHVEVALAHPARLIANALGSPPPDVIASAHDRGMLVAALAGKAEHARRQVASGVDIVVAQGHEAGGHTGEIGTMVLVPEVVDAVAPIPVLAAGGIGNGRQIAAAMALGAQGVWCGSVWLTTPEAETHAVVREKMLRASSGDTVRTRATTGKPARQLRTAWTQEWDDPAHPDPLPMPLHTMLTAEAQTRVQRAASTSGSGAEQLITYFVGQVVGSMNSVRPAAQVVHDMVVEYLETAARLSPRVEA